MANIMKLQQLRYAVEVLRQNLNISDAADALFTSQPGVSKQIRLLEDELGTPIFIRSGKRIVAVTPAGKMILETAKQILHDVQKIKHISGEFVQSQNGTLTIGATHNHVHYRLPHVVEAFLKLYPDVNLNIRQGTPDELVQMVQNGEVDFAISTETNDTFEEIKVLSCFEWHYGLLIPHQHPLSQLDKLNMGDVCAYPLISYHFSLQNGTALKRAFGLEYHQLRVALSATDSDVLKTYVRLGLGIGLIDEAAYDSEKDKDLVFIPLLHLISPAYVQIVLRSDALLRQYSYDFIELFHKPFNRSRLEYLLYSPPVEDFSI